MGNGKSGGVKQEMYWYTGTYSNPISCIENRDWRRAAESKNATELWLVEAQFVFLSVRVGNC